MAHARLHGTWRLVSVQFVDSATGERGDVYGADPLGYIVLTPDNRMMTIITARERPSADGDRSEAGLFESMMAYAGAFEIEGEHQFVTDVEVAWHPSWKGTKQARTYSIEDGILSIVSPEMSHPMFPGRRGRGVLKWERVSAF